MRCDPRKSKIRNNEVVMNVRNCQLPTKEIIRDKILGCWIGKNIGGTLGGPFEGKTCINNLTWYERDPGGSPLPNDDLDLQLMWLDMAEFYGVEHLTLRHFGEMWLNCLIGPWGEYSNCRYNCLCGFFPPLSGACDNDGLNRSNGAWIRAEIWACLCAGKPDEAIRFAWMDACCDHITDGIYAEMFISAMEAAAFCISDIRELIRIGLSKIPDQCRLRDSIELVIAGYDAGKPWQMVREEVMELNADMGWFQAPGNVAFVVIGLLYGEGDFAKTVCTTVNCGDDADCTGATAGALLGIILGATAIPADWKEPIGDAIAVHSLDKFSMPIGWPQTVTELTDRVIRLREIGELHDLRSVIPDEDFHSRGIAEKLWHRSSYELEFDLLFAKIGVEYLDKPYLSPGVSSRIRIMVSDSDIRTGVIKFRWQLPENWQSACRSFFIGTRNFCNSEIVTELTPPQDLPDAMMYVGLEVSSDLHDYPTIVTVPFRRNGSASFPRFAPDRDGNAIRRHDAHLGWINKFRNDIQH